MLTPAATFCASLAFENALLRPPLTNQRSASPKRLLPVKPALICPLPVLFWPLLSTLIDNKSGRSAVAVRLTMEPPGFSPGWISICTGVARVRLICSIPCSISRRLRIWPSSPGNAIVNSRLAAPSMVIFSSFPSRIARCNTPERKSCSVRKARLVIYPRLIYQSEIIFTSLVIRAISMHCPSQGRTIFCC